MKTTIDLPDELVKRAKAVALSRQTSLRALVERGLRREIEGVSDMDLQRALSGLGHVAPDLWRDVDAV